MIISKTQEANLKLVIVCNQEVVEASLTKDINKFSKNLKMCIGRRVIALQDSKNTINEENKCLMSFEWGLLIVVIVYFIFI